MTTSVNTCFKCNREKPVEDFYRHPAMRGGRVNKCKECNKLDNALNRQKRIDYYREYDRQRGARQSEEYREFYRQTYPEKERARHMVSNAVRDGRLIREPCEKCGREYTHGHHDDYSRPLDVRWLCPPCHFAEHRRLAMREKVTQNEVRQ